MSRYYHELMTTGRGNAKTWLMILCLLIVLTLYRLNKQLKILAEQSGDEMGRLMDNMFFPLWSREMDFEGFDNNTGTESGCYLVPNVVHFLKLDENTFSFIEMVCIIAAYKRQRPQTLYIHTNMKGFVGKYWDYITSTKGISNILVMRFVTMPADIFGIPMKQEWRKYHGSNFMRIGILKEFGGIFLNNDIYLVKDLNDFRRFEMTLGWTPGKAMGNHILIAHKDARFLKEYLANYESDYNPNRLTYNAAVKPTLEILNRKPYLVHRVQTFLGTYIKVKYIYMQMWNNWRDYYALRLLIDNQYFLQTVSKDIVYPKSFQDYNIENYKNITFYEMVNDIFDSVNRKVR